MAEAHHGSDPMVGMVFNDFRIEEPIARGGMGAVYLCRHLELPSLKKVLKVLVSELEPDPWASPAARANAEREHAFLSNRFEREARAVAELRHQYIVPIDWFGTLDGRRCILMPFLDGKSLEQVLEERGGRLTLHETLRIVVQIARALDHAHRKGIVHRDLKPANIFVVPSEDDEVSIRVFDFGIAKQMHQEGPPTVWRGPAGTSMFMAVEQFERAHEATPQSDVYSLAVIVYLMVEGRYPWGEQPNAFAQYRCQLETLPAPATAMPPEWEESVRSALSPDPAQRPRSMHEFVYPLAMALEGGREILREVARRWLSISPDDMTIRAKPSTGAWRAAPSGAWTAASGSWPTAASGMWPVGSRPVTVAAEESWLSSAAAEPSSMSGSWPTPAEPTRMPATAPPPAENGWRPAIWKLVLLATAAAVLAAFVVFALVRALEGR